MDNLFLLLFFVSIISLVVGLVKPTVFSRFIKGGITRKRIGKIFGIATIICFVLFAITTNPQKDNTVIVQPPVTEKTQSTIENQNANSVPVTTNNKIATETSTPVQTQTPSPAPQTGNQNTSPVSNETVSQTNAVEKV